MGREEFEQGLDLWHLYTAVASYINFHVQWYLHNLFITTCTLLRGLGCGNNWLDSEAHTQSVCIFEKSLILHLHSWALSALIFIINKQIDASCKSTINYIVSPCASTATLTILWIWNSWSVTRQTHGKLMANC